MMFKFFINCSILVTLILVNIQFFSYGKETTLDKLEQDLRETSVELNDEIPPFISESFKDFCSGQHKNPAIRWIEHNRNTYPSFFNNEQEDRELIKVIDDQQSKIGKCIDYSFFGSDYIPEQNRITIYLQSHHDYAPFPIYWKITIYDGPKGLAYHNFKNSPNYTVILPPNLLIGG